MAKKNRIIVADHDGNSRRKPTNIENPHSYYGWNPSWNFSKCDKEHDRWSLKKCANIYDEVISKLISFEGRTWGEIISDEKHNHWIECSKLCKEAQQLIIERHYNYDTMFSLRLEGKLRLFGTIDNGIYYVIWYDKEHEICPSPKKHT